VIVTVNMIVLEASLFLFICSNVITFVIVIVNVIVLEAS
jgi:hypothetical protein